MGGPVWSHDGMIAVGNAHKDQGEASLFPRGEPSSRNIPDSLPWHQIFEWSDSMQLSPQGAPLGSIPAFHRDSVRYSCSPWPPIHGRRIRWRVNDYLSSR